MCNACHNMCCGSDMFGGCGCDHCDEPECWDACDVCDLPNDLCQCFGDHEDCGPDLDHVGRRDRPEFLG